MSSFDKIKSAVQKMKQGGGQSNYKKDDLWSCEMDKSKNGMAVIRFLPAHNDADLPWVFRFSHGFQGDSGKWFIENCRTSLDEQCPVCEANAPLWKSGVEANKEIVRKRKRKQSFYANILVVSDPRNPDNEGKVFTFRFGKKIFDKIMEKIDPPKDDEGNLIDPDDKEMNPFDPLTGCAFKVRIREVEKRANFDKSEFLAEPYPLENVEELLAQVEPISRFLDPAEFKDYAAQKKRFEDVIGQAGGNDDIDDSDLAFMKNQANKARNQKPSDDGDDDLKSLERKPSKPAKADDGDDSDMDFFRNLANGD